MISTKHRSSQSEIMDDLRLEGAVLRDTLDQIARINRWLGGNRPTLQALKKMIANSPEHTPLSIIDIGCGNGDMLRTVARFGRKHRRHFRLTGIDANEYTIDYARQLSVDFPEITYLAENVFSEAFNKLDYDIALFNLFLHHFREAEIIELMSVVLAKAKRGIVVNDLHRNALAYYLFKLLTLGISNPMVRNDGLVSILRGFKKKDFIRFSQQLNVEKFVVQWKWAFRWVWIVENDIPAEV